MIHLEKENQIKKDASLSCLIRYVGVSYQRIMTMHLG